MVLIYIALLSKRVTVLTDIHPFTHTFTPRRRSQPRRATASSLGAIMVRCLAQGHHDTDSLLSLHVQLGFSPHQKHAKIHSYPAGNQVKAVQTGVGSLGNTLCRSLLLLAGKVRSNANT